MEMVSKDFMPVATRKAPPFGNDEAPFGNKELYDDDVQRLHPALSL